MTEHRLSELFTRLSEKANLSKQYAQRTVFANAPYLSRLCRRHTSMLASYRGFFPRNFQPNAMRWAILFCAFSAPLTNYKPLTIKH